MGTPMLPLSSRTFALERPICPPHDTNACIHHTSAITIPGTLATPVSVHCLLHTPQEPDMHEVLDDMLIHNEVWVCVSALDSSPVVDCRINAPYHKTPSTHIDYAGAMCVLVECSGDEVLSTLNTVMLTLWFLPIPRKSLLREIRNKKSNNHYHHLGEEVHLKILAPLSVPKLGWIFLFLRWKLGHCARVNILFKQMSCSLQYWQVYAVTRNVFPMNYIMRPTNEGDSYQPRALTNPIATKNSFWGPKVSRFYKYSFSSPKTSSHPTLPHEQYISQFDNNNTHQFIPTIPNPLTRLTSTKKFSKRPTVDPLYTPISQTKATLTAQIAQLTLQTYSLLKTHTSENPRTRLYKTKKLRKKTLTATKHERILT